MNEGMEINKGYWESLDDTDGLKHNCQCLLEDTDGNIWIGTWRNGLCRYDGAEFISFSNRDGLPGNDVKCIYQDKDKYIWIGTGNGLCRYNGQKFISFSQDDALGDSDIWCIYQDQNEFIWIGAENGLSVYDGEKFIDCKSNSINMRSIHSICQDREGNIWLGMGSDGLVVYDGKAYTSISDKDGYTGKDAHCLHSDEAGDIWIGGANSDLIRYDGTEFTVFDAENGLPSTNIYCISHDSEDNLWIGTLESGACYYNGTEFINFTTKHGLAHNAIRDIMQDREGNIWFACYHGGITMYDPHGIVNISDEFVGETMTIDEDKNIWWGSGSTISKYDGNTIQHYPLEYPINDIFEDSQGQLWIGTMGGGVFKYCTKNIETEEPENFTENNGILNNGVWRFYEDRQGNIWIGTWGGINRYDGKKITKIETVDNLGMYLISTICQDRDGMFWFGGVTESSGMARYDGKSFHRYTVDNGLPDNLITSIVTDNQNALLIGTSKGLSKYDGKSFCNYTCELGLSGNVIQRLMQDSEGKLWIATLGGGIGIFDGQNFQAITTEDGLPSNCVTGLIEDDDGSIIISTYKGVCRYLPRYNVPPLIRIDEVDTDRVYREPKSVKISESMPSVRIKYHGISYRTKRMRYSYMLEGYDIDWRSTWDKEVRYETLPVGKYTFKVMAINRDMVYSDRPAELELEVTVDARDQVISELEREVSNRTEELRNSEERLKIIFEYAPDAYFLYDLKGVFIDGNRAAEAAIGYKRKELIGKNFLKLNLLTPRQLPRAAMLITRSAMGKSTGPEEFILNRRDGSQVTMEISTFPVKIKDQTHVLGIARDITERRRTEEELLKMQKFESVELFASGIAHDLNNILTIILGNLSLSKVYLDPEHSVFDILTEAEKASDQAEELVKQLLTFSKGEAPQLKETAIAELLHNSVGLLLSGSNTECDVFIPDDLWLVDIDSGQINQAINNLIINADQAMPEGGAIKISAENVMIDGEHIHSWEPGRYVMILVEDQGVGISEELIQKVFDPYFTTKKQGNGLGLAISQAIIKKHNGYIRVESRLNVGTTFRIYLPAVAGKESRKLLKEIKN